MQLRRQICRTSIILLALLFSVNAFAQIEKLPPSISDPEQSEGLPVISADGKSLFFTRAREGFDGSVVLDVWRSSVIADGTFSEADVLGGNLSLRYSVAVTSVSPDNNSLYLIGKLHAETPPEDRLMLTQRTKNGWTVPASIRIQGLN